MLLQLLELCWSLISHVTSIIIIVQYIYYFFEIIGQYFSKKISYFRVSSCVPWYRVAQPPSHVASHCVPSFCHCRDMGHAEHFQPSPQEHSVFCPYASHSSTFYKN